MGRPRRIGGRGIISCVHSGKKDGHRESKAMKKQVLSIINRYKIDNLYPIFDKFTPRICLIFSILRFLGNIFD